MTTKAITLHQPWATLVIAGVKQFETRSWQTNYRGRLAIHAGKRWTNSEKCFAEYLASQYPAIAAVLTPEWFASPPLGSILGVADLKGILPTEYELPKISKVEKACGNYDPGRFAWRLGVLLAYEKPIPHRGYQGLWNAPIL